MLVPHHSLQLRNGTRHCTHCIRGTSFLSTPSLHFLTPSLGSPTVSFCRHGHLDTFGIPQTTLAFHRPPTCRPSREPRRGCIAPPLPQHLFSTTVRKTLLKSSHGNFRAPVYLQRLWRMILRSRTPRLPMGRRLKHQAPTIPLRQLGPRFPPI